MTNGYHLIVIDCRISTFSSVSRIKATPDASFHLPGSRVGDLRCHVGARPAERFRHVVRLQLPCEVKVAQLDVVVEVQEDVLAFEVSVDDRHALQVLGT